MSISKLSLLRTSYMFRNTEYVIVDIETTGFSVEHCHIIEIAALKIVNGDIVDSFHTFVKQDEPIPLFITNLTGITDKDVAGGKAIYSAIAEFAEFLGELAMVGHNVSFDYRFLNYNCEKYLNGTLSNECIDTMRLAKELIIDIPNFKLGTLIDYFKIANIGQHRADNDIKMTYEIINCLSNLDVNYREGNLDQIQKSIQSSNQFINKRIAIKTKMKYVQSRLLECIFTDMDSKVWYALYPSCDVLILNESTYNRFCTQEIFNELWEPWLNKAKQRFKDGRMEVYSERQVCELLNIQIVEKKSSKESKYVSAKDIAATTTDFDESHQLYQKNCVFTGTLDRYDRKTAMQYVANVGGICQNGITKTTDYLILADNSFCAFIKDGKSSKQKKAEDMMATGSGIQIISESTFYQLLKNE